MADNCEVMRQKLATMPDGPEKVALQQEYDTRCGGQTSGDDDDGGLHDTDSGGHGPTPPPPPPPGG